MMQILFIQSDSKLYHSRFQYIQHLLLTNLMKSEARLLPQLNQLYIQKKSYQVHKKKLQSIKRSASLSKKSLSISKINENQEQAKSHRSSKLSQLKSNQKPAQPNPNSFSLNDKSPDSINNLMPETHMQTIQQVKPGISYWMKKMNPLQKRIKQQQIKQNKRMRQKIKNTTPFIVQKNQFNAHLQYCQNMKRMLSKFSINEGSNKTQLKCEIVLEKISQLEKQKLKTQQSRIKLFEQVHSPKHSTFDLKKSERFSNTRLKNIQESVKPALGTQSKSSKNLSFRERSFALPSTKTLQSTKINHNIKTKSLTHSQGYSRIKTEPSQRNPTNRLFNSSKLSQLSASSTVQKNLGGSQNLKPNYTQPTLRKIPIIKTNQIQTRNKLASLNVSIRAQPHAKNLVANRIKTELSQKNSILRNESRNSFNGNDRSISKANFQRKRIQRYMASKSTVTVKQLSNLSKITNPNQQLKASIKPLQKPLSEIKNNQISIVQEKNESKMNTIDSEKINPVSKKIQNKKQILNSIIQDQTMCFATAIQ